ncbi:MAG: ABC transporter ATP-binding protein [Acidimicrobiia bacterium]|nr:MAG: ABC transporter ATP-binding protein [Acidimicrobiia bacterium]
MRAEALSVWYGVTRAVDNVHVEISSGEIVAVMGRSGSGKSTLLHALAGIRRPDAGGVWYRGRRVDTMTDRDRTTLRRTEFGFVFQHGQLVPELTAAENVELPLLLNGRSRRAAEEEAASWIQRLGIGVRAHALPSELSGGEVQRVALARAMAIEPSVVFADEPTGSLDSDNARLVMSELVAVATENGTAVLLVTHDSATAAGAARCLMLHDGRLVDE